MWEYFEDEKAKKKALSTAEKKELKKNKDEAEAKFTTCLLDGRKEKVGNFRVEPPGLFRGRGDHPKKGALKVRPCVYLLAQVTKRRHPCSCVSDLRISPSILVPTLQCQYPMFLASGSQ